jgi:hypothetical protein
MARMAVVDITPDQVHAAAQLKHFNNYLTIFTQNRSFTQTTRLIATPTD